MSEAKGADPEGMAFRLALRFLAKNGASDAAAAMPAAAAAIAFLRELAADLPVNTAVAIRRARRPRTHPLLSFEQRVITA